MCQAGPGAQRSAAAAARRAQSDVNALKYPKSQKSGGPVSGLADTTPRERAVFDKRVLRAETQGLDRGAAAQALPRPSSDPLQPQPRAAPWPRPHAPAGLATEPLEPLVRTSGGKSSLSPAPHPPRQTPGAPPRSMDTSPQLLAVRPGRSGSLSMIDEQLAAGESANNKGKTPEPTSTTPQMRVDAIRADDENE